VLKNRKIVRLTISRELNIKPKSPSWCVNVPLLFTKARFLQYKVMMWSNVAVKRMQEIIATMSGSRIDPLPGHYRQRVLEERLGEDDSGTSSTELRRVSLLRK